jgi:hypothetical protein
LLMVFAWAEDHVRLFQAISAMLAILIGGGGFVLGWLLRHTKANRERENYRELVNDQQIVIEAHVLTDMPDGTIRLDVDPWGPKHSLSYVFNDLMLEREVRKVAKKKDGLMLIPKPGQFLMMTSLRDAIVGNDWTANPAALKGRPVEEDQIIFAPISWPGIRDAQLLRVIIIDPDWIARLIDPNVISGIIAVDDYYQYRAQWLHDIALAWTKERQKDREEATIWQVSIRSPNRTSIASTSTLCARSSMRRGARRVAPSARNSAIDPTARMARSRPIFGAIVDVVSDIVSRSSVHEFDPGKSGKRAW